MLKTLIQLRDIDRSNLNIYNLPSCIVLQIRSDDRLVSVEIDLTPDTLDALALLIDSMRVELSMAQARPERGPYGGEQEPTYSPEMPGPGYDAQTRRTGASK